MYDVLKLLPLVDIVFLKLVIIRSLHIVIDEGIIAHLDTISNPIIQIMDMKTRILSAIGSNILPSSVV